MSDTETKTIRGPARVSFDDGETWWTTERTMTTTHDWRETPWGKIDFGCVYLGPIRRVKM